MSYFTENPLPVYAILAVVAVVLLIAFWRTQRTKYLGFVGMVAALALIVGLIDHFVETDREIVARRTKELVRAADLGNFDEFASYVSKDFYVSPLTRDGYLFMAKGYINPPDNRRFVMWNLEVNDSEKAPKREFNSLFSAKATGSFRGYEEQPVRIELAWKKDADAQWRVRSFRLLNPVNDSELPLPK